MGFILKSYKRFVSEHRRKVAPEIYQLREYDNKLWLTYQGGLVCPCDMLSMEPVEAVNKMRELYIERENQ